jgi:hypothetical protein
MDIYCASCRREREAIENQITNLEGRQIDIKDALSREGECYYNGEMFAEKTRRVWSPGEHWKGDFAKCKHNGICPKCYRIGKRRGLIVPWTQAEWKTHLQKALDSSNDIRGISDVLSEASAQGVSIDRSSKSIEIKMFLHEWRKRLENASAPQQVTNILRETPQALLSDEDRKFAARRKQQLIQRGEEERSAKKRQQEALRRRAVEEQKWQEDEERGREEYRQRNLINERIASLSIGIVVAAALMYLPHADLFSFPLKPFSPIIPNSYTFSDVEGLWVPLLLNWGVPTIVSTALTVSLISLQRHFSGYRHAFRLVTKISAPVHTLRRERPVRQYPLLWCSVAAQLGVVVANAFVVADTAVVDRSGKTALFIYWACASVVWIVSFLTATFLERR